MDTLQFPQFDPPAKAHIALLRDVNNAAEVKARIIAASTAEGDEGDAEREAVNFAFIEASLITSRLHLQTAIHQALLSQAQDTLRTRTVHSEILYFLNHTHNITEALRRYGISNTSTDVLVVRIDTADATALDIESKAKNVIKGRLASLDELSSVTDWNSIKKYYKLNAEPAIKGVEPSRAQIIIDTIVVSSVAMKSVMQ